MVQRLLHKLLVELAGDDVKAMVPQGRANSITAEAFEQFIAGALFGLLMWRLDGKDAPIRGGSKCILSATRDSGNENSTTLKS